MYHSVTNTSPRSRATCTARSTCGHRGMALSERNSGVVRRFFPLEGSSDCFRCLTA